jgi:uncharacterized membrane protein
MSQVLWKYSLAGLLILVPAWATLLILSTLFSALNELIHGLLEDIGARQRPGLSFVLFLLLVIMIGAIATHVVGQRLLTWTERWIEHVPLVRSVYSTLKGMTDLLHFRSRFGRSAVVAFPFPRDGVWAIGFVMGTAPPAVQIEPSTSLMMIFVPTAVHPFTGYLAFVPTQQIRSLNLLPEDAMKMEFSAGFYTPRNDWLRAPDAKL